MHSTADVREAGRSPTFESYSDVERHIARANSLRAEVTAQMLAAAFRSTAGALCIRAARWQRQRRTYGVLMRCSDRTLADIGIAREDIALVARGIEPGADQRSAGFVRRGWSATWACLRALPARLDGARRAQRDWRRAYGELMAYTDRELERSASGVLTSRRPSAAVGLRPGSPSRGAARRPPPRALLMACLIDNGRMVRLGPVRRPPGRRSW
jgi:uncharacterized protein YjiS (DUF1127 family)